MMNATVEIMKCQYVTSYHLRKMYIIKSEHKYTKPTSTNTFDIGKLFDTPRTSDL